MSKLLEIRGLYGGYEKGVDVLQGISLSVEQGEIVGVIGLNGSGKSTLGKSIMNLLPYRRGSIVFKGQPIEDKSTHELAQMGIALMHQGGAVFPNLSIWQNLQLAWNTGFDNDYYKQLEEFVPLLQRPKYELMHQMADRLSGGQRHELALAMALARQPQLVILDEPSAGFSPQTITEMYYGDMYMECLLTHTSSKTPTSLNRLNGIWVGLKERLNLTIILVEQNIPLVLNLCDRTLLLAQGTVSTEIENHDKRRLDDLFFGNND